jgi:hypothetical protein
MILATFVSVNISFRVQAILQFMQSYPESAATFEDKNKTSREIHLE